MNSTLAMFLANVVITVVVLGAFPILPRRSSNHKVRLAGSRFSPLEGEIVSTRPTMDFALEDRPVEGTLPVHSR
jgi:hypothetical protein